MEKLQYNTILKNLIILFKLVSVGVVSVLFKKINILQPLAQEFWLSSTPDRMSQTMTPTLPELKLLSFPKLSMLGPTKTPPIIIVKKQAM